MAFLVPTLLGYIDKTKKQMIINEARDVWVASQAALTECYGLHPESFEASCKFTSSIGGRTVKNLGRISNGALGALQKNPNDTVEAGTSSRRIAGQVLKYLDSADKNANPRYTFGSGKVTGGGVKPSNYFGGGFKADRCDYSDLPYRQREDGRFEFRKGWLYGNDDRGQRNNLYYLCV